MKTVPIVFAFDNNLILPACVCISSLMMNSKEDTFYDIFILYSKHTSLDKTSLDKISSYYSQCRIQYRTVDETFDKAFEIRGVTTPTYYRLLIPNLIHEYDKIFYADVDIIFRMDLSDLYEMDLSAYDIAATLDLGLNYSEDGLKYITSTLGIASGKYLQAGFMLLNVDKIRKENKVARFIEEASKKYKYQDQDILNVVCKNSIKYLPPIYNMTDYSYFFMCGEDKTLPFPISKEDLNQSIHNGNLHYNGHKPWKKFSVNFDIWWEYYRKSPFFDEQFYFKFFYDRLNLYDQLSLWKRIKILVRYFVFGIRKI